MHNAEGETSEKFGSAKFGCRILQNPVLYDPYRGQEFLSIYAETLFHRPAKTVHVVGMRPFLNRACEPYKCSGGLSHLLSSAASREVLGNELKCRLCVGRTEPRGLRQCS
jgi:hypothetical protein